MKLLKALDDTSVYGETLSWIWADENMNEVWMVRSIFPIKYLHSCIHKLNIWFMYEYDMCVYTVDRILIWEDSKKKSQPYCVLCKVILNSSWKKIR